MSRRSSTSTASNAASPSLDPHYRRLRRLAIPTAWRSTCPRGTQSRSNMSAGYKAKWEVIISWEGCNAGKREETNGGRMMATERPPERCSLEISPSLDDPLGPTGAPLKAFMSPLHFDVAFDVQGHVSSNMALRGHMRGQTLSLRYWGHGERLYSRTCIIMYHKVNTQRSDQNSGNPVLPMKRRRALC